MNAKVQAVVDNSITKFLQWNKGEVEVLSVRAYVLEAVWHSPWV